MTNSLNFLPQVDEVIVLENGGIAGCGAYDELLNRNQVFSTFIKKYLDGKEANIKSISKN